MTGVLTCPVWGKNPGVAADDRPALPTAPRDHDRAQQRRGRQVRLVFLVALVLFVLVAAAGLFGEHSRAVTGTGGGYELTVNYPQSTRPGLSSSIEFVIRRLDGGVLPDTLALETDMAYLRLFDDHAVEPAPDEVRADGEEIVWALVPEGDATELRVFMDGRIDPGLSPGRHAGTTTLSAGSDRLVTVSYRTWVWP